MFVCLIWKQALSLRLGEVAIVGNFLFVSNIGNQAALPLVLQEAVGKDSEHSGCAICPLYG